MRQWLLLGLSILILQYSFSSDLEKKIDEKTSLQLFEALATAPKPKLEFDNVFGNADDPSKPHDWLDPKVVNWGAGNFSISCRIEVIQHGTKAKLDKSKCIIKIANKEVFTDGASAVTIYKRLMNAHKYYKSEEYTGGKIRSINLGPISIEASQKSAANPVAALKINEDFVAEANVADLGISGKGH